MRKLHTSIALTLLALALSSTTIALAQSGDTKKPAVPGDASTKAKEEASKALPATKEMDKAASPDKTKTGVPDSGAPASGKALPATKEMDKAASPEKSGAPNKY
jgi:hypothetical protein